MAEKDSMKGPDAKAEAETTIKADEPKVAATKDSEIPKVSKAPTTTTTPEPTADGYTKKGGALKWVLIYLIIAAIIYGAYYYFVMAGSASTPGY